MVWELFDSTAYDADKFTAMLDEAVRHADAEQQLRRMYEDRPALLGWKLAMQRHSLRMARLRNLVIRLPPEGFTVENAKELFRLSGDL